MTGRALLVGLCLGLASSCLSSWNVGGPWACRDDGTCAEGYSCDDGVCCVPGGAPACPTLPVEGQCPLGATRASYVRDRDGDGFGDEATRRDFCRAPTKELWVTDGGDCDDGQAAINPNAVERCNAIDDDCDGEVDEGLRRTTWYLDADDDGFGVDTDTRQACAQPPGYAASSGDCDDASPERYLGAPERCNGIDDNCNGQLDDPPFIDVENPGQDGGLFPCDTGRPGACQAGGLQCVFREGAGFEPTCVARVAPQPDVCGNGLDEDCSGVADDRPGCGGPANLLGTPGIGFGAIVVTPSNIGTLPTTCLKDTANAPGMGWLNPAWIMSSSRLVSDVHVWWAEAPAGETWDVSQATSLRLAMRASPISPNSTLGTWGAGRFPNAVVALCGPAGELLRYVPSGAALVSGGAGGTSPFVLTVPLRPAGGASWSVTGDLPGTLPRVKRVEVWMSPEPPSDGGTVTVTNTFVFDAGLPGFR